MRHMRTEINDFFDTSKIDDETPQGQNVLFLRNLHRRMWDHIVEDRAIPPVDGLGIVLTDLEQLTGMYEGMYVPFVLQSRLTIAELENFINLFWRTQGEYFENFIRTS